VFHRLRRRMSPATALAATALFVALGGTAVAQGVIISSPDQLGPSVVTSPAIATGTVTSSDLASDSVFNSEIGPETVRDSELRDPQLKVRSLAGSLSGQLSGSDGTVTRVGKGQYDVTFDVSSLNASNAGGGDTMLNNNCAYSAISRNSLAMMEVDGPSTLSPNTVRVRATFPQNVSGGVLMSLTDAQFDLLASC
jgi:hypothetical protein